MAHITLSQLSTVLGRIASWSREKFAAKDGDMLAYEQWPRNVIYNISDSSTTGISAGEIYFVSRQQGNVNVKKLVLCVDEQNDIELGAPIDGALYIDKSTKKVYQWDMSEGEFVEYASGLSSDDIVNDLVTGGQTKALSAGMGIELRRKAAVVVDEIKPGANYSALPSGKTEYVFYREADGKIVRLYQSGGITRSEAYDPDPRVLYLNLDKGRLYKFFNGQFRSALTVDDEPVEDSTNPITSGAVYSAIEAVEAGTQVTIGTGDVALIEGPGYIDLVVLVPEISVNKTSVSLDAVNDSAEITVTGTHLKGNISAELSGTDAEEFTLDINSITQSNGSASGTLTVSYDGDLTDQSITGKTAKLTLSSTNAQSVEVNLLYSYASSPTILANPASLSLNTGAGSSTTGTLNVSGFNLTENITATASGTGFSVCATENGTYGSTATLPSSGGTLYVKWEPAGSSGVTGSLTLSSTGATSASVQLNGGISTVSASADTLSITANEGSSQTNTLTVTGANLRENVTASVSGDFTVSTSENGTYGASATITKEAAMGTGGATLYVKYTPSSGTSSASVNLSLSSSGASKTVALNGTAVEVSNFSNDNNHRLIIGGIAYGVISDGNGGWKEELAVYNKEFSSAAPSSAGRYTGEVIIPSKINALLDGNPTEFDVTTINAHAFNSSTGMTKLVIPDSVTSAGAAFLYLTSGNMKYLSFGNGLINAKVDGVDISTIPVSGGNGPVVRTALNYLELGTGFKRLTGCEFKMSATGTVVLKNPDGTVSVPGKVIYDTNNGNTPANGGYLKVPSLLVPTYKTASGWGEVNSGGWYLFDPNNISAIENSQT